MLRKLKISAYKKYIGAANNMFKLKAYISYKLFGTETYKTFYKKDECQRRKDISNIIKKEYKGLVLAKLSYDCRNT